MAMGVFALFLLAVAQFSMNNKLTAKIQSWGRPVSWARSPPLSDEFTSLNFRSLVIGGWATVAAAIGDKVVRWLVCATRHW
jgi:hypothetical protein